MHKLTDKIFHHHTEDPTEAHDEQVRREMSERSLGHAKTDKHPSTHKQRASEHAHKEGDHSKRLSERAAYDDHSHERKHKTEEHVRKEVGHSERAHSDRSSGLKQKVDEHAHKEREHKDYEHKEREHKEHESKEHDKYERKEGMHERKEELRERVHDDLSLRKKADQSAYQSFDAKHSGDYQLQTAGFVEQSDASYVYEEGVGAPKVIHIYGNEPLPPQAPGVHYRIPIIEETVQPVIVEVPQVVLQEQHINEHIVRPTVYKTIVEDDSHTQLARDMGSKLNLATPPVHAVDLNKQYVHSSGYTHSTAPMPTVDLSKPTTQTSSWQQAYPHSTAKRPTHSHENQETVPLSLEKQEAAPLSLEKQLDAPALNSQGIKKMTPEEEEYFKHTSLDIRSQLSVERLADLQSMGNSGLPTTFRPSHVDRVGDDLARGSEIGLE